MVKTSQASNPYQFTVKGVTFDFYDLSDAIGFKQSAVEHAVKKLVALGTRSGKKSYSQDLHEAIMSLLRAQEQYNESLRCGEGVMGIGNGEEEAKTIPQESNTSGDPGIAGEYKDSCSGITTDDESVEQAVRSLRQWSMMYDLQTKVPLQEQAAS